MNPSWIEISLSIPAELAETCSSAIFEETGLGSCLEDPEAGGGFCLLKTYFPYQAGFRQRLIGLKKKIGHLMTFFPEAQTPQWDLRLILGEDWQENWKRHFKPLRVCSNIIICPTWETVEQTGAERVIWLDPGQAFGTGGHSSTRLCLKALEAASRHPGLLEQVLDLGTGTGILGLVAAVLGARAVLAIDNDPLAVESARDHVRLNKLEGIVRVEQASPEAVTGPFSLILANLTFQALQRLAPVLKKLIGPQGSLIVSGFLTSQTKELIACLVREKIPFQCLYLEDEWACAVFGYESAKN
jgi:ribosomal protein L11 methyltransferase